MESAPSNASPFDPKSAQTMLEWTTDGFIAIDRDWRITYCNPSYLKLVAPLHAAGAADLIGKNLWERFPQIVNSPVEQTYRRAMERQEPESFEMFFGPLQAWIEVRVFPSPESLSIFVRDITERRLQEQAVQELSRKIEAQAQLFDSTLSNLTDLAYSFDREGRFTYANRPVLALLGLPLDQVIGKNVFDLNYPQDLALKLHGQILEVVRTGKPVKGETQMTSASGVIDYHEYTYNPVFAKNGSVVGVAGSTRYITERKRTEAIGEAQRQVLLFMAEDRPLGEVLEALVRMVQLESEVPMRASILLMDEDGVHLRHGAAPDLPEAYNQMVNGMTIGPMMGSCGAAAFFKQPVAVADIAIDPRWVVAREAALGHGLRACWSMPIFSTQGGRLLGTFAQYYSEAREPNEEDLKVVRTATRTAAIAIERKRVETALRQSEERFRRMSDSAPVPIWMTDVTKACVWVNKTYLEFTGHSLGEELGRSFERSIHPDDLSGCLNAFTKSFDVREDFEAEYRVRRHDGAWRWWLCRGAPAYGAGNEFTGYIGSCVDITERRAAQEELERLVAERTAELTESNSQLETLVYSIAHDLRAPLRSMQGFAEMLLEDQGEGGAENTQLYAKRIARAAGTMDALVLDLLAYGRVTRSELELAPVDVAGAWQIAMQQFEADIGARRAWLEIGSSLPVVIAHEATLGQILANLLGNALKFVPPGRSPHVRFRAEDRGEMTRLWVEDNGIGIATHHQERIFRVFERLHGRDYGGTGIGLSIVRKGAERMGGRAGVVSNEGEGSSFWIELTKA
ncbi:MAG: PAS domain S-box protein [Rariglobus sp.]